MINNNHLITPPPELVQKWALMFEGHTDTEVFTEVGQWFADQELEACCTHLKNWFADPCFRVAELRTARRPKPPSLKEILLARVARIPGENADSAYLHHWLENESHRLVDALHKAIDSLPD